MIHVSDADLDRAAQAALDALPEDFRPHLENVLIEVQSRPAAALLKEYEETDDLLGIYVGVPLEDKGPEQAASPLPDRILIFRENLCAMCASWEELVDEIRVTVLHEIGHHFGLDEDRLADLGYD